MIRLKRFATLLFMSLLFISAQVAVGQSSSFSYQGRLQDSGASANGSYDFQFTLWDSLSGGTQQPQPSPMTVTKTSVAVANGVFTVQLDFGASAFPGANRWLETSARLAGGGAFTLLSPRQPINSTPYAVRSLSAASADSVPVSAVPSGSGSYIQNTSAQQAGGNFNISGNGTSGGTLSGNVVNATTQYNLNGNRLLSTPLADTFLGLSAGAANTTGGGNTFVGRAAGQNNTAGFENAFFGDSAGFSNIGVSNSGGVRNAYFGYAAGASNTAGSANAFFGNSAGRFAMGKDNSFFGFSAGQGNSSGQSNTGEENTFIGVSAGAPNTTGSANTFVGSNVGISNTTGNFNVFLGLNAGLANVSGNSNVYIGRSAGGSNTDQDNNTAVGAVSSVAAGITNATAIGSHAAVTQSNSLVLGSINGIDFATADTSVGIGTTAPQARLDVRGNSAFIGNVGIGTLAPAAPLEVRKDGAVASDWQQGQLRISGQANPARQLSLGYDTSSNLGVIQAGEAGVAFRDLLLSPSGGNVGIGTNPPSFKLHVNGETRTNTLSIDAYVANNGGPSLCANTANNRVALCTSSLRYKTNVQSFRNGLGIISRLRPISFDWKDGGTHDVGLAAEEVARVEPLLTFRNNKGEIEGVKYNQLSAVFINAFKEQQAQILEQQDEIKKEKTQLKQQEFTLTNQQRELEALKQLVCRSHRRASACR